MKEEMGRAFSAHGEKRHGCRVLVGKAKERED
jgi:hypothetical protein